MLGSYLIMARFSNVIRNDRSRSKPILLSYAPILQYIVEEH